MESAGTRALARLANRSFHSFSEATDSVLTALHEAVSGTIVLTQIDPEAQGCRVIDVKGPPLPGLDRGSALALTGQGIAGNGSSEGQTASYVEFRLDAEFVRSLGVTDWLASPLEMSDGSVVGQLCAFSQTSDVFGPEQAALLGISGRLLGHEWESVQARAELRRLRLRLAAGPGTDRQTGLPDRERFLELLEHEWRLTKRGSIASTIVVCRLEVTEDDEPVQALKAMVELKAAAEVLGGTVRATDRVGRIGAMSLAAILPGCKPDGADAFIVRFEAALRRVTGGRALAVEAYCGAQDLAGAESPEQALQLADKAAELVGQNPAQARAATGSA